MITTCMYMYHFNDAVWATYHHSGATIESMRSASTLAWREVRSPRFGSWQFGVDAPKWPNARG